MEPNRAAQAALRWTAAAALALALFTLGAAASVRFAATSGWWWERGFERYDAAGRSGLSPAEVSRIGAELRGYLRNDDERLSILRSGADGSAIPVFSEREVTHMVDVKRLMARTWDAGWAAFGYIAAFAAVAGFVLWRGRGAQAAPFARAAAAAGGAVAALVAVLAIVAVSGFDEAFRQFHLLFFTNDLWQLSRADALIQLFPQRFFFDTTLLIGASILIPAALVGVLGWLLQRRLRRASA